MNTETFGQIEAFRRWTEGYKVERLRGDSWGPIAGKETWRFDVIPSEFISHTVFRLAAPAPVKPVEEEQMWICGGAAVCRKECGIADHRQPHAKHRSCNSLCQYGFKCIPVSDKPKAIVQLSMEDVPPGSRFKSHVLAKHTWDVVIIYNGVVFHYLDGTHLSKSWKDLMEDGWLVQRPGQDWQPCKKPAPELPSRPFETRRGEGE